MTERRRLGQNRSSVDRLGLRLWILAALTAFAAETTAAAATTAAVPTPAAPISSLTGAQVGGTTTGGTSADAPVAAATTHPTPVPSQAAHTQALGLQGELSAASSIDGGILLINVTGVPAGVAPTAKFEETELPFYTIPMAAVGTYQAVLGVPFNHKPGPVHVEVTVPGKGEPAHSLSLPFTITDGKYPSEKLTVAKRNTSPKKADVKRILRDIKVVGAVYRQMTREKLWNGPFTMPIQSTVTSIFGTKRVFNGKMQSFHQGLDLRAPIGTPIHASAGGIVALAEDLFFTGNTVLIDHGYGVFTLYAHLSKLEVKKGQRVAVQEVLGLSGKTGRVSGPHLHWGAIIHKAKVNPQFLTEVMQ